MTPASSYLIQTAADTRFSHIGRRLYSKQRSRRPKAEVIFKPKGKFAACDLSKARSRQRWLILVSLGTQRAHNYTSMLIKASPSTQTAVEEHRALDEEVARPTIVVALSVSNRLARKPRISRLACKFTIEPGTKRWRNFSRSRFTGTIR